MFYDHRYRWHRKVLVGIIAEFCGKVEVSATVFEPCIESLCIGERSSALERFIRKEGIVDELLPLGIG